MEGMRTPFLFFLCLTVFTSIASHAQSLKPVETLVVFDPLFWKDQLKLTGGQSNSIRKINTEYYEAIYQTFNEHEGNIPLLKSATTQLLQERSEKIWDTFLPKQKRKWKKLSGFYSDQGKGSSLSSVYRKNKDYTL